MNYREHINSHRISLESAKSGSQSEVGYEVVYGVQRGIYRRSWTLPIPELVQSPTHGRPINEGSRHKSHIRLHNTSREFETNGSRAFSPQSHDRLNESQRN